MWSAKHVEINNSTFTNCSADESGGGVWIQYTKDGPSYLLDSTFKLCNATEHAGAVAFDKCYQTTVTDCVFDNNLCNSSCPGALSQKDAGRGQFKVRNCEFCWNSAGSGSFGGGAIEVKNCSVSTDTFQYCYFHGNTHATRGHDVGFEE